MMYDNVFKIYKNDVVYDAMRKSKYDTCKDDIQVEFQYYDKNCNEDKEMSSICTDMFYSLLDLYEFMETPAGQFLTLLSELRVDDASMEWSMYQGGTTWFVRIKLYEIIEDDGVYIALYDKRLKMEKSLFDWLVKVYKSDPLFCDSVIDNLYLPKGGECSSSDCPLK